jgi:serine/threonine-protein kinase
MTEHVGRVVGGRYRLLAPLGSGASAEVYLADDVRLRRRVAVKILHSALAADESFLRRFRAEARAAAALSHPNILAIFDWNGDEVPPYIVTEYLSGGSLRSMLDAGHRLSPSQALLVGLSAAQALDRAHRQGFVHRDIKPANLLFGGDTRLRIADFGLARAIAEAGWTEPTGAVLGTARYSSPEQARGEPLDGRSDVYSLALVLVEAVTGVVPFTVDTTIGTLMARLDRSIDVSDDLEALAPVVAHAGQLDPDDRPDAAAMAQELIAAATDLARPAPLTLVGSGSGAGAAANGDGSGGGEDDRDRTILHGAIDPGDGTAQQPLPTQAQAQVPIGAPIVPIGHPSHSSNPALPPPPRLAPTARAALIRKVVIGGAAAVIAIALGVAGALVVTNAQKASHVVPTSLVGKPKAEVVAQVGDFGWRITYEERNDDQAAGIVLDTKPAPGSKLKEGDRLVVIVSLGPPLVPVPESQSLRGMTQQQADEVLRAEGIELVPEFVPTADNEVEKDHVIGLAEGTATELPKGTTVQVLVSSGPAGPPVPDMTGWWFEEAEEELSNLGFTVQYQGEQNPGIQAGQVIRTDPPAGQNAAQGSTIVVVVAQNGNLVRVPDLSGRRVGKAREMLQARGLVVGNVNGGDDARVITSTPLPGTEVSPGTPVDLWTF